MRPPTAIRIYAPERMAHFYAPALPLSLSNYLSFDKHMVMCGSRCTTYIHSSISMVVLPLLPFPFHLNSIAIPCIKSNAK